MNTAKRYCRNCGNTMDYFTCPRCNMPTELLNTRATQTKNKSNANLALGIISLIILILLALICFNDGNFDVKTFFVIASVFEFVILIIFLIIELIRKQPKKYILIGMAICFVVLIAFSYDSTSSATTLPVTQSREMTRTEYINQCKEVEYKTVARNPNNYKGNYIKFTGEVIQVLEGNTINLRVNQESDDFFSSDIWLVIYSPSANENRILEGDTITVYGICAGLVTYKSIFNQQVSVPSVEMKYYDLISD